MREDLKAGATFPDVKLLDHSGNVRSLSELAGGDPVVVHFYRGWFCPKERRFFAGLLELQAEAEVAYSRIVSISVEPPEVQAAYRAGLGARWTFLSDEHRVYVEELELLEAADTVHRPFLPTVFTLYPDLRICRAYGGNWYWGRPTLEELRADMRTISKEIRSDWEPSGK
ncbi:MAG: redoxin domain-containing protein [Actinobacteria bacterium]|jgi:peroxiredoxin|nr:redoxin domain-containing protein [Actinomycetota bacterium]